MYISKIDWHSLGIRGIKCINRNHNRIGTVMKFLAKVQYQYTNWCVIGLDPQCYNIIELTIQ